MQTPSDEQSDDASHQAEKPQTQFSVSAGLGRFLGNSNAGLAFTSYQSGLLYCVGLKQGGGINIHHTNVPKPMGLYLDSQQGLTMTSGYQIIRFENVLDKDQRMNEIFDACYVPRKITVTGELDAHDVGVDASGQTVFVNTRFNCLARPATQHSFEEIWRPPFISALIDEDRCHLNGLATEDGVPRYATAVSRSDTIDGWRDRRSDGGVVMDLAKNKVVCDGLSMPHSPRLHNGDLWVLNSGTGELGVVAFDDSDQGTFEPRVFCPGFLRGLAFHNNYALVGLSKPRYKRFEGLELDQTLRDTDSEPWCGIQIIDINTGTCVDWIRIDGAVAELYDLELLPGVSCPMAISPTSAEAASLVTYERGG